MQKKHSVISKRCILPIKKQFPEESGILSTQSLPTGIDFVDFHTHASGIKNYMDHRALYTIT
jgi:hypothetical protein